MRIRPDHPRLSSVLAALFVLGVLLALWTHDGVRESEAIGEVAIDGRSAPRAERIESAASEVRSSVLMPEASARRDVAEESMNSEADVEKEVVVEMLVQALEDPDPRTFAHAVEALSRLDPERLESVLGLQLEEGPLRDDLDESEFRTRAALELGVVGGPGGVDLLIRAFEATDPAVREAAAIGLARTGNERALEFLVDEVAQRPTVANIAALGMTGDPEALGLLIEAFQVSDPRVRQVAAQALAALGQPDADAFLLEASRDARLDWSEPAEMAIALRRSPEASLASPGAVGPQYLTRYLGSR